MTALHWFLLAGLALLVVVGRFWFRLLVAVLVYAVLDAGGRLGARLGRCALKLDRRIDEWRHELQRRDDEVERVVDQVGYAVRHGATRGEEEYNQLDDRDMDLLARAIDNLGCYVQVWPRRLQWRRRDLHCTGSKLGLHALAPADRDAFADAIANLDGEGEG